MSAAQHHHKWGGGRGFGARARRDDEIVAASGAYVRTSATINNRMTNACSQFSIVEAACINWALGLCVQDAQGLQAQPSRL